jgi:hypothetical protein
LFQGVIRLFLSGFLITDTGGLKQFCPAVGADLGQSEAGIGLVQLGLGLEECLIHFRRLDFREHLAVGYLIADVHKPIFQITAGPGMN